MDRWLSFGSRVLVQDGVNWRGQFFGGVGTVVMFESTPTPQRDGAVQTYSVDMDDGRELRDVPADLVSPLDPA